MSGLQRALKNWLKATSRAGRQLSDKLFADSDGSLTAAEVLLLLSLIRGSRPTNAIAAAAALVYLRRYADKATNLRAQTPSPDEAPVPNYPSTANDTEVEQEQEPDIEQDDDDDPPIEQLLRVDVLRVELGYELVSLVESGNLLERIPALRREIAKEYGIIVPPVYVCDNLEVDPGSYRILLNGTSIGQGECRAAKKLAIDPTGSAPSVDGDVTTEPTFGIPARWITPDNLEFAEALGYTVVDHETIVATHLGELVRVHAHRLLGLQELHHLLDVLAEQYPRLVEEVVPELVSVRVLLQVLRNLLRERVSIRDLRSILEAVADQSAPAGDPEQLTDFVREQLMLQITGAAKGGDGSITALTLAPELEQQLRSSLDDVNDGKPGALEPALLWHLAQSAEQALAKFNAAGVAPLIITPPDLRRWVSSIFEFKAPQYAVLSFREIDPTVPLRVVETLGVAPSEEQEEAAPAQPPQSEPD